MLAERSKSKWRGRERQRASGHGVQRLRDIKMSAWHKAIRTWQNDRILQFSWLRLGLPFSVGGLFLTGQGDEQYKKAQCYPLNGCRVFPKRKADNHILVCVLSALRLCVRLVDNSYLQILCINQGFFFTLWAIKRIVFQNSVFSDFITCFTTTNWAIYPFTSFVM